MFLSTSIKLKLPLSLHLLRIAIMIGWSLYFKIAFKVESLVLLTKVSPFEYLEISRFCTILEKKLFKTSAVSRSVFTSSLFSIKWISSLPATLSNRRGFTVFQNSLLRHCPGVFIVNFEQVNAGCDETDLVDTWKKLNTRLSYKHVIYFSIYGVVPWKICN